jgi:signal transduction histidine kinase
LDDLQWADLASLQLLKLLMSDNGYLLLLGAYRDNEVSPTHPFIMTVAELQKEGHIVNTITLTPLDLPNTNHLVADTLKCSKVLAQPLTELIDRKTKGNPFFTTQFLKALHQEGHIYFNRDRRYWECNISQVNALALTDDVVEFMALQLQKLSAETQQVLKLAACIGNQFDLTTLAIVSERSPTEVTTALWKALQEGLILPTSQVYKFFQDTEFSDSPSAVNPNYRFLHDRVQQASYTLIPEDQKQETHWKIGQLLLQKLTEQEQVEQIFEIVNQLDLGREKISEPDQKRQLAELNLKAGQKAKLSAAYQAAQKYYEIGLESLTAESSWFYSVKIRHAYLFNQQAEYPTLIPQLRIIEETISSHAKVPSSVFYVILMHLALIEFAKNDAERQTHWQAIVPLEERLNQWQQDCPENIKHKCLLIQAEKARLNRQKSEAMDFYDQSIAQAQSQGYEYEAALASELAAIFYLDWGKEKVVQEYLKNAYYGYAHWGAKAKVQDLERRYPKLLAPILRQQQMALSATETMFSTISIATTQSADTQSSNHSSTSISSTLDLATALKASQTLSSEIQLDKLLSTLLRTVLENAGADKGALLMPRGNEWFVEAVATVEQPAQVQSTPLVSSVEVPQSLINIVKRSLEPMVIAEASVHPTLAIDAYIMQQEPKSLLCTPILSQGKLVAILYLENRVSIGAFTSDRVELLNFLCTQAAISLENARLYQQAQNYAQQIEQSQLQIVQSEKMASLGNLVAGVAHEINNPIGFLNGSINNAKDYTQDLLDYVSLYQQHHPNAALPVLEKAEDIDLEFLNEDLPKLLDSMKGATDRIRGISNSLRTFSRSDTEHKVSANLREGIDSTLLILKYRLKANEYRPAIEVIQDYGDLPTIQCFPGQLNQVFMNILANAIDIFDEMVQGMSFEQLKSHPQQITIRTTRDAKQVQIQISDNGKGMTEDVRARIFDHLFTTKGVGKGTGLGLAIARQIVVEKHGGSLDVKSELDQGTEFSIRLPIGIV